MDKKLVLALVLCAAAAKALANQDIVNDENAVLELTALEQCYAEVFAKKSDVEQLAWFAKVTEVIKNNKNEKTDKSELEKFVEAKKAALQKQENAETQAPAENQ